MVNDKCDPLPLQTKLPTCGASRVSCVGVLGEEGREGNMGRDVEGGNA